MIKSKWDKGDPIHAQLQAAGKNTAGLRMWKRDKLWWCCLYTYSFQLVVCSFIKLLCLSTSTAFLAGRTT